VEALLNLPSTVFIQGGAVMLLAATVWLVMTGRLVPRSTVEDARADRDGWRKTAEAEQEINRIRANQFDELLELARTTDQVIRALPQPGQRPPRGQR
jgi:hypothetical protein